MTIMVINVSFSYGGITKRPLPTTLKLPVERPLYVYLETDVYLGCFELKLLAIESFLSLKANLFLSKLFSF